MPSDHDPYAALRHRDYCFLLSGGVLTSIGSTMQNTVVAWEIYQGTDSALGLAFIGLAQFLPILLLALPAGQLADRHSRKHLLQLSQAIMILSSLGLAALSLFHGPIPLYYVCLVMAGISRALSAPARTALVSQVVPSEHLGNAVTWNSSGWQIANVSGPALGGLLIFLTKIYALAYCLTALCALIYVLLLSPIRPRVTARLMQPRTLSTLLAGVRFVWNTDLLLAAITLDLFAVLLGGVTALLPIYTKKILEVDEIWFGLLRAAPAMGAVVMGLILAHRPPLQRAGPTLLAAVAGFGAATIVFGLSTNVYLSFLMLMLVGALDNISVVVRGTLMQILTPDDMRGRVAAVNTVFISSSNELGEVESGYTAWQFGPVVSAVGGGIGTILVVILVMIHSPKLMRLGELRRPDPKTPEASNAQEIMNEAQSPAQT